jgi:hypothetical protein
LPGKAPQYIPARSQSDIQKDQNQEVDNILFFDHQRENGKDQDEYDNENDL